MIRVASYNIRKAIGLDRRRDPARILAVLREIDADIIALQEADRRFGSRASALPLDLIDTHSDYRAVPLSTRPDSIGWHGNALLVRKSGLVDRAAIVPLPALEPRGAIGADLRIGTVAVRVIGMHLDLSGIRRRHQVRAILDHAAGLSTQMPTVLMGDLNEWSAHGGALRDFASAYSVLAPGHSFHARRPIVGLDRIMVSADIRVDSCGVHHSALAATASDHLPVWAQLMI